MKQPDINSPEYFESLRERIRKAVDLGEWQAAIDLSDEAISWADRFGDEDSVDLAVCNHAGVLIACGKDQGAASKLRRILLGSTVADNRFLAAFYLSRFHELRRETQRGLFYARLALGHAETTQRQEFRVAGYNQIGILELIDCRFEAACEGYQQALRLSGPELTAERTVVLSNIGYCKVVLGHYRQGFGRLFESLRLAKRLGVRGWEMLPHMVLSYAYLKIRKLNPAKRHASRALKLAEAADRRDHIMNSLYLLGESEKLLGNELAAFEQFDRLQRDFYPDKPFIADFLMATDVGELIHLMA